MVQQGGLGAGARQLAGNVWLVSLGCSGGVQRACRAHLYIIQLGFYGKPILLKIGRFSLCAYVKMGWICPARQPGLASQGPASPGRFRAIYSAFGVARELLLKIAEYRRTGG